MNASNQLASTRRYDLDWLRTLGVLLVLPFHALLVFVMNPDSVVYMKDTIDCGMCDRIAGFINVWHMPMMFLIAGMSAGFALRKRSGGQFLRERFFKLLIPFLFGVSVLVPPMTYLYRISQGVKISFWQHYAGFWTFGEDLTGRSGTWTPTHLWFIMFLILFSLIALPLLLLWKRRSSQGKMTGTASFLTKPMLIWVVLGFIVAVGGRTELMGATNPVYFLFIFVIGALLVTDERYTLAIDRDLPWLLAAGVILEVMRETGFPYTVDETPARLLRDVAMEYNRWAWTLVTLGAAHRLLSRGGKVLDYLSEASYPIYIMHFLVLTAVTYLVIRLNVAIPVKYALIVLVSYAIIFLLYEGVRRVKLLRFLLGMKTKSKQPADVKQPVPARV